MIGTVSCREDAGDVRLRAVSPSVLQRRCADITSGTGVLARTARQGAAFLLLISFLLLKCFFRSGNYRSWSSAGKAGSPTSAKAITSRGLIGRDESRPKSLHPQVVPEQSPDLKPSENEEPGPVSIPECSLSLPAFPFCGYWYARNAAPHHNAGAGAGSMRMKCELEWSVRELAAAVEIVHLRLLLSDLPTPHDFSAA